MRIGMPEWLIEKYAIAQSEGRTETAECKRIFCCAYREYDEKKGATGEPGGVLHMQQELMGNRVKAIRVQYIYRTADDVVLETVEKELSSFTERVITSAGFIASHKEIAASIDRQEHPVLVCHDLGCAYGAYLLGLRYILVYHQQGSILAEIESAGAAYSDEEAELITRIEKTVIDHAVKMYFPSNGAKEEFKKTVDCKMKLNT